MSDTPAPAAAGGGSSKMHPGWWVVIALIVVFSNVVGVATGQIGDFFQMLRFNLGVVLAIAAVAFFFKAKK